MFRVDSNLSGIIRQTERLVTRLPVAMEKALAPDLWRDEARAVAFSTLHGLANAQDAPFVGQFVQTMLAAVLSGGGLSLQMRSPFPPAPSLAAAQAAKAVLDPAAGPGSLFLTPVQEFEALILKWVETPEQAGGKRRDARDAGKTDEDIAQLISYIMLTPFEALGPKGQAARQKLTPHIEAFVQQQQARTGMSEVSIDQWLRAVLAAWRTLVRFKYADKLRAQLYAGKGDLL